MNIYFTAAISQKDKLNQYYELIVDELRDMGHSVVHEHVSEVSMADLQKEFSDTERTRYYKKVVSWIKKADIVVAELSFPSTINVGHEVSIALEKGKPVVGLYKKGKKALFFQGISSEKFIFEEYEDSTLKDVIRHSIDYAADQQDTRFNFFVSPKHQNYLDWISKNRKIPRAVFLRRLIEETMEEDKEYNS